MSAEAEISTIQSAMANLEVSGVEVEKQVEQVAEADSQPDRKDSNPSEKDNTSESPVQEPVAESGSNEDVAEKDLKEEKGQDKRENKPESASSLAEASPESKSSEGGGEVEAAKEVEKTENGEKHQDFELLDANKLMQKLDIGQSIESDDEGSSSMDSTANSGACHVERDDPKTFSSEDCSEGGSSRPKKRIDLQHQLVREIVKIQHDRDQYDKQCKEQGKQTASSVSQPRAEPVKAVKPSTGGEEVQTEKSSRTASLYRPPYLRSKQPSEESLKITFDTRNQKRSIHLGGPPVVSSEDNVKSPGKTEEPSAFEFKSTTKVPERNMRGRGSNRFRASRAVDNVPPVETGFTPKQNDDLGGVSSRKLDEVAIPPLPPKDKPFAAERWSDMVESDDEGSTGHASSSSTPEVLESKQQRSPVTRPRERNRKKEMVPRRALQSSVPSGTGRTRRTVFERLEFDDPDKQRAVEQLRPKRRNVFERLGPREVEEPIYAPRLRTVRYEAEGMRDGPREYSVEAESSVAGKASRNGKEKRSGYELYVPRRGS